MASRQGCSGRRWGELLRAVRSERGQGIVEAALTLPLVFTLFFGVIEFSLAVLSYNTIANAAREGARFGVVAPNNVAGMESAARRHVTAVQCSGAGLTVTPSRPTADTVRVQVQCDLPLMTQMMVAALGGQGTILLQASATMQVE